MFDYPVGGNIDDDVGYVKDDESNVKLVTSQVQIVNHAVNFGIAGIASVNERKQPAALLETCSRLPGLGFTPYSEEPGDDVSVEFSSGNLGNIGRNVYMHLFAPKHFNMALLWLLRLEPEFLGGFGHGLPDISGQELRVATGYRWKTVKKRFQRKEKGEKDRFEGAIDMLYTPDSSAGYSRVRGFPDSAATVGYPTKKAHIPGSLYTRRIPVPGPPLYSDCASFTTSPMKWRRGTGSGGRQLEKIIAGLGNQVAGELGQRRWMDAHDSNGNRLRPLKKT
jgi:hypothetical protein